MQGCKASSIMVPSLSLALCVRAFQWQTAQATYHWIINTSNQILSKLFYLAVVRRVGVKKSFFLLSLSFIVGEESVKQKDYLNLSNLPKFMLYNETPNWDLTKVYSLGILPKVAFLYGWWLFLLCPCPGPSLSLPWQRRWKPLTESFESPLGGVQGGKVETGTPCSATDLREWCATLTSGSGAILLYGKLRLESWSVLSSIYSFDWPCYTVHTIAIFPSVPLLPFPTRDFFSPF